MSVIHLLSPHMADLIAAGEVVERPASVVKELIENAVDAGAKHVTVELRGGGMRLIRVSDDGCGMSPEDAGIAFQRHATSKLKDEHGLESIATLGFRGEALAAISSVSKIELTTRERGVETGTRMLLAAGEIEEMGPVGCPEGTVLAVSELFYNTPARRKFVRTDRAEGGACTAAALRCALGQPEVSFRLLRDGEEVFFSPGDGDRKAAVYALLGREAALDLLPCLGEGEGIRVEGFVSAPHACRGSRNGQFFFLNGRSFRSSLVQKALEQAYQNTKMTGKFPGCVLYLALGFHKVDVNVHPTKMEVRFSEEQKVFHAVYAAVRAALEEREERNILRLSFSQRQEAPLPHAGDDTGRAVPQESSPLSETAAVETEQPLPPPKSATLEPLPGGWGTRSDLSAVFGTDWNLSFHAPSYQEISGGDAPPSAPTWASVPAEPGLKRPARPAPAPDAVPPLDPASSQMASEAAQAPAWRLIGEALNTYILVELSGELLLIDKHACHERINFNRLKAGLGPQMSQILLTPIPWSPGAETTEVLEQNAGLLEEAGFQLERFGEDGVVLRAAPAELAGGELAALEEVAEALKNGKAEDLRDEVLRSVACKASIRAGVPSAPQELAALAEKVVSGEIRYCPHGRPVVAKLRREDLDRQFRRIV